MNSASCALARILSTAEDDAKRKTRESNKKAILLVSVTIGSGSVRELILVKKHLRGEELLYGLLWNQTLDTTIACDQQIYIPTAHMTAIQPVWRYE